jgi:ABC-type nitrate/sulfonate/bicarbonate transport system ATPase subunit
LTQSDTISDTMSGMARDARGENSDAAVQLPVPAPPPAQNSAVPLVSVRDVGFAYPNGVLAVNAVDFDIRPKGITSIVGPSGCGKSTLLRMIAGLATPTNGTVIRDASVEEDSAVTMVFQTDTLFPWLTVEHNLEVYSRFLPMKRRRSEAAARRVRTKHLLEMVGLARFSKAYPYQLSGGMRRRLAFVAAVAPSPRLLLLDEPFASVDEPTRIQIHQDILHIIREQEMTAVLVTHDLAEAISLSDTVIIMTRGPGSVYKEHHVDFGMDRDVLSLRQGHEYLQLYGELWEELAQQIRLSKEQDD